MWVELRVMSGLNVTLMTGLHTYMHIFVSIKHVYMKDSTPAGNNSLWKKNSIVLAQQNIDMTSVYMQTYCSVLVIFSVTLL